jgi:putative ABC transport system permease protein
VLSYVLRDVWRNPRRTLASVAGVALAVGLFSGISFFIDSSAGEMTSRAIAPVTIDMQAGINNPLGAAPAGGAASTATADLGSLAAAIKRVPGVAATQPFASVDLPANSLRLGTASIAAPLKVVAFDPSYPSQFTGIRIDPGSLATGSAALSQQAVDVLGASPQSGATLLLNVPGAAQPLSLRLGGTADFSQAQQLFASRNPDTQGDFVAAPYVLALDMSTFQQSVLPALRIDAASPTPLVKTPPVLEAHVAVSRSALAGDPATASVTTQGLRRTIERIAPGEVTVVDNLTDALTGARTDAILAKVLFIFLGLPGILLAAYLSHYAGGLLAEAQRRERATLRARGIGPAALHRGLAYNAAAVAVAGSVLGLALGFGALALLFRDSSALHGSAGAYLVAIGLSILAAAVTTTLALYLPGRRALLRQVVDERREAESESPPQWLRARVDLVLLAVAGLIGLVTYLTGGYSPSASSESQSVSLSFYVLLAPLLFWVGAVLLCVRGLLGLTGRWRKRATSGGFERRLVRRTLGLSVLRRPKAAASGVVALSLAVAFGVSLMTFANTYQAEKVADARFVVGGDLRVSSGAGQATRDLSSDLRVPGVQAVTPLAQTSSLLVGTDRRTLVAIDPRSFTSVATLDPAFLTGMTPDQAMAALSSDPNAVLVDQEIARTFNIQPGDSVKVQVPNRSTGKPVPATFKAVATFTRFPGFPQGVDVVANLASYRTIAATAAPETYLLATDGTDATNSRVAAALTSGPGKTTPLLVETTATTVNKEQSTLAALNLSGLSRLETVYAVLMSSLGIAIFVFGLLLQRRKEHITMRALGIRMRQLQGLIIGEAGLVAALSLVIGGLVGAAMASMSVQILKPIFTIPPSALHVPAATVGLLAGLAVAATVLASLVAGQALRRTHLIEILREE